MPGWPMCQARVSHAMMVVPKTSQGKVVMWLVPSFIKEGQCTIHPTLHAKATRVVSSCLTCHYYILLFFFFLLKMSVPRCRPAHHVSVELMPKWYLYMQGPWSICVPLVPCHANTRLVSLGCQPSPCPTLLVALDRSYWNTFVECNNLILCNC